MYPSASNAANIVEVPTSVAASVKPKINLAAANNRAAKRPRVIARVATMKMAAMIAMAKPSATVERMKPMANRV